MQNEPFSVLRRVTRVLNWSQFRKWRVEFAGGQDYQRINTPPRVKKTHHSSGAGNPQNKPIPTSDSRCTFGKFGIGPSRKDREKGERGGNIWSTALVSGWTVRQKPGKGGQWIVPRLAKCRKYASSDERCHSGSGIDESGIPRKEVGGLFGGTDHSSGGRLGEESIEARGPTENYSSVMKWKLNIQKSTFGIILTRYKQCPITQIDRYFWIAALELDGVNNRDLGTVCEGALVDTKEAHFLVRVWHTRSP
ncbi:hypothetical protein B0H14DRAFT_2636910 [Mycena olivaceomarginata]|nr:hypothetical protein B0H14DRAFT_2636910 [Mycena olivaceomarginata]